MVLEFRDLGHCGIVPYDKLVVIVAVGAVEVMIVVVAVGRNELPLVHVPIKRADLSASIDALDQGARRGVPELDCMVQGAASQETALEGTPS